MPVSIYGTGKTTSPEGNAPGTSVSKKMTALLIQDCLLKFTRLFKRYPCYLTGVTTTSSMTFEIVLMLKVLA